MKRSLKAIDAARDFAVAMGQDPLDATGTFMVHSKSCSDRAYPMQHTPEGYAVHQGEGCTGEAFNGPLGCWHSKEYSVNREEMEDMTNIVKYEAGALVEQRQFNAEELDTIKSVICKGASDAEYKLFVATCQHTGLDPFMKQIHAIVRPVNNGTRENPKWEKQLTIAIGIDGYRLIADRTGQMEGLDGPQWTYDGTTWVDLPRDDVPPLAARAGVWRKGLERPFVAVCRWGAYVQSGRDGKPNSMWAKMGPEQLAKCAEALALRRAFPAEMSSLPQRPDFIDPDAIELERDWTPEQVAQNYTQRVEAPTPKDDEQAPPTADVCAKGGEHEPQYSEDTTLLQCSKCGIALEEPDFDDAPAPPQQEALMK